MHPDISIMLPVTRIQPGRFDTYQELWRSKRGILWLLPEQLLEDLKTQAHDIQVLQAQVAVVGTSEPAVINTLR